MPGHIDETGDEAGGDYMILREKRQLPVRTKIVVGHFQCLSGADCHFLHYVGLRVPCFCSDQATVLHSHYDGLLL